MISVPQTFAAATIAREGEAGRAWLAALPGLVAELCQQWRLRIEGPALHGYLGLVIPVWRGDEPCALKVAWSDASGEGEAGVAEEALALAAWDGRGAVRLLAAQPAHGALLLERLDHLRTLDGIPIGEAVVVAGHLLRRLAIPAPVGVRTLSGVAQGLGRTLPQRWEQAGRPMPQSWMERACALAARLGPASEKLLVNYDLHYLDVLGGERDPWLAVDPKVVSGDPEYGVAQLLWNRLEDILASGGLERHFGALVAAAGLDADLARAWTIVRCVDYWLWALSAGLTDDPARCAAIVQWLMERRGKR